MTTKSPIILMAFIFVASMMTVVGAEKAGSTVPSMEKTAVETIQGVPMITRNGVPARARIFWGQSGAKLTFNAAPEPRTIDFAFTPSENADHTGTIHFRFDQMPGTIVIKDFSIVAEQTGKTIVGPYSFQSEKELKDNWRTYHDEIDQEKVAVVTAGKTGSPSTQGMTVSIRKTPSIPHWDFHVYHQPNIDFRSDQRYRVRFTLQSDIQRTITVGIYRPGTPFVSLLRDSDTQSHLISQVKMAKDAGVDFVSFLYPFCWKTKEGTWNWRELDSICDSILATNPNALLIPRVGMDAPAWWLKQNPEEQMVWKDEEPFTQEHGNYWASTTSNKYRETACEALTALIDHLEKKYGSSIAGYHPYGQNTGEWFTPNTWGNGLHGFGVAEGRAWQKWLVKKYKTDQNLQTAWKDSTVSLKTVTVPTVELRRKSMSTPILDTKIDPRYQSLIDFNEWTQEEMTDTILALAKTVRKATNGKKLSLFFYGYSFEFGPVAKGPAASAHYNLRTILNSPDIDIVCSPMSYFDRQPGGGGSCMLPAESVTASGKIYLYEDDTRTYLANGSTAPGHDSGADSLQGTQNLLLRNNAESAVRNFALWWMDLGNSGWFEDPRLWDVMRQLNEMDNFFLKNPLPYRPEIGIFIDEASMLKISSGKYSTRMIYEIRKPFNRLGAPYGQYLLDDLISGRMTPPKLCVVLNPQCLTADQLKKIKERTQNVSLLLIDFEGITAETLRTAAKNANVFLYTEEPCNVWANGPYAVIHAAADGVVHFTAPNNKAIYDVISGKKLSDNQSCSLLMKIGETRVLHW